MDKQQPRGSRIASRVHGDPTALDAPAAESAQDRSPERKNRGLGRIIIAVYAVFALSALARSTFQLFTIFHEAPVAITLSMIAAAVYVVATISLARTGVRAWYVAMGAVIVELLGIIVVSVLSYADPQLFPKASVWSHFGQGYGYVPFALPFVGLWWLLTHRPRRGAAS
ncbi:hypothetical protein [Galactobacter caseinivorans]|uniref:hypothetical protein n=1 Tax=Galactobacter caseinivorans TaxID=2676123 RepID=UPI001F202836|nr:hypothetical protein [Galactobacter caseinivorans]